MFQTLCLDSFFFRKRTTVSKKGRSSKSRDSWRLNLVNGHNKRQHFPKKLIWDLFYLIRTHTGIDDPDKGVSVAHDVGSASSCVARSAAQTLPGCVRPTELCAAELTPTDSFMIASTQHTGPSQPSPPPAPALKARPFNNILSRLAFNLTLSLEAQLEIVNEVLCNFMSLRFMNGGLCAGQASLCSPPWLTLPCSHTSNPFSSRVHWFNTSPDPSTLWPRVKSHMWSLSTGQGLGLCPAAPHLP